MTERREIAIILKLYDSLAQSVEHLTFNQGVRSSNLRRVTIFAFAAQIAGVAELADALDLGSSEATRAGSSPVIRIAEILIFQGFFFYAE